MFREKKIWEKEQKATEEESQASFTQKIKLREGTCYFCVKTGNNLPDCTKAASTTKYKWTFKILESTVSLFPIESNRIKQEYYFPSNAKPNLK